MANIESAKKRIRIIRTKTLRNQMVRSQVKTAVRKVRLACQSNDAEAAKAALLKAESTIDKAKAKGVIKKQTASRKVSRLYKMVNKIA